MNKGLQIKVFPLTIISFGWRILASCEISLHIFCCPSSFSMSFTFLEVSLCFRPQHNTFTCQLEKYACCRPHCFSSSLFFLSFPSKAVLYPNPPTTLFSVSSSLLDYPFFAVLSLHQKPLVGLKYEIMCWKIFCRS